MKQPPHDNKESQHKHNREQHPSDRVVELFKYRIHEDLVECVNLIDIEVQVVL